MALRLRITDVKTSDDQTVTVSYVVTLDSWSENRSRVFAQGATRQEMLRQILDDAKRSTEALRAARVLRAEIGRAWVLREDGTWAEEVTADA